jgi:hypothetical protein
MQNFPNISLSKKFIIEILFDLHWIIETNDISCEEKKIVMNIYGLKGKQNSFTKEINKINEMTT